MSLKIYITATAPPSTFTVTLRVRRNTSTPSNTAVDVLYDLNGGGFTSTVMSLTTSYQTTFTIAGLVNGDVLTFGVQQSSNDLTFGMGNLGAYTGYCGIAAPYTAPAVTATTTYYMNVQTSGTTYTTCAI